MYYNLLMYKNLRRFESQMTVDVYRGCVLSFRMPSCYTKPSPDPYELIIITVTTTGGGMFLQSFVLKKDIILCKRITQSGFLVPNSSFYVPLHNSWNIWLCTKTAVQLNILMIHLSVSVFRNVIKLDVNCLVLENGWYKSHPSNSKVLRVSAIVLVKSGELLYQLHRHINTTY